MMLHACAAALVRALRKVVLAISFYSKLENIKIFLWPSIKHEYISKCVGCVALRVLSRVGTWRTPLPL